MCIRDSTWPGPETAINRGALSIPAGKPQGTAGYRLDLNLYLYFYFLLRLMFPFIVITLQWRDPRVTPFEFRLILVMLSCRATPSCT
eukprot:6144389-Pyramimonas_sp.AAC.1